MQRAADHEHERHGDLDDDERVAQLERAFRVDAALASLSAGTRSGRDDRSAGISPNTTPVNTATSSVKTSTRQSGLTARPRSMGSGGCTRAMTPESPAASGSAIAPPSSASSTLSVSSCRTIRDRSAPNAARSAISRRRPAARASMRFARFAHATTRTRPTAATMQHAGGSDRGVDVRVDAHVARGHDADAFLPHGLRELLAEPTHEPLELGAHLRIGDARLHAALEPHPVLPTPLEAVVAGGSARHPLVPERLDLLDHRERDPHLGGDGGGHAEEVGRRDPEDRVDDPVHPERLAHDVRRAGELRLPEPVAQDSVGRGVEGRGFLRREGASERRTDT